MHRATHLSAACHLHIQAGGRTRLNASPAVAAADPVQIEPLPHLLRCDTELHPVRHASLCNDRQRHGLGDGALLGFHSGEHPGRDLRRAGYAAGGRELPQPRRHIQRQACGGAGHSPRQNQDASDTETPEPGFRSMLPAACHTAISIAVATIDMHDAPPWRQGQNPAAQGLGAHGPATRHDRRGRPVLASMRTEWGRLP